MRELIAKHYILAEENGAMDCFKVYAEWELKRRLQTMLFNGFGEDARQTLRDFGGLFSWYVRWGGRLLATFPKTTSAAMRSVSWFKQAMGLKRQVTRRYGRSEVEKHTEKRD